MFKRSFSILTILLLSIMYMSSSKVEAGEDKVPPLYWGAHKNIKTLKEDKDGNVFDHGMSEGAQMFYVIHNAMLSVVTTSEWTDKKADIVKVVRATRTVGSESLRGIDIYTSGRKSPIFMAHTGKHQGANIFVSTFKESGYTFYVRTWVKH